ncbi:hypothetical protein IKG31_00925 [Candidatus Saccharibacteria bacterium]|nr:hypothetical protein [Candidatus Saccharibacteria bacterium]
MTKYLADECVWNPNHLERLIEAARLKSYDEDKHLDHTVLGISSEEYNKCCGYKSGSPSIETVVRIADYFAVPLDYLLGRCTEEEAKSLLENYAEAVKTVRVMPVRDFDEPWPYNLLTDAYFTPFDRPLTDDQLNGLERVLSELTDRERDIIYSRYRNSEKPETYRSIGKRWGVTTERIRAIHCKTLRKLRAPFRKNIIMLGIDEFQKKEEFKQKEAEFSAALTSFQRQVSQIRLMNADLTVLRGMFSEDKEFYKKCLIRRFQNGDEEMLGQTVIEDLDFSVKTYNCLKRARLNTVADLMRMTTDDFYRVRNLGRKRFEEIVEKIRQFTGLETFPLDSKE